MHKKKLTYKKSGVDTSNTNNLIKFISNLSNKTKIKGSTIKGFKNIGGFGSLFDLGPHNCKNPVLVSATDGVGTKLEIANRLNLRGTPAFIIGNKIYPGAMSEKDIERAIALERNK